MGRAHTLKPDRLAGSKKKAAFRTMTDKLVLTDGARSLVLNHMRGYAHEEGRMLPLHGRVLAPAELYRAIGRP